MPLRHVNGYAMARKCQATRIQYEEKHEIEIEIAIAIGIGIGIGIEIETVFHHQTGNNGRL